MSRQICLISLLAVATGCSQRSPWVTVPAPAHQDAATPRPSDSPFVGTSDSPAVPADATAVAHLASLLFPVAGVDSSRLDDSFDAPRDGGARRHNAIDIMAPRGAPVLSAGDGRVLRLSRNEKGGITVYATDLNEQFVYYYAHLDRYHSSMYAGKPVMRGDTLGYVGTTGNAPSHVPHLHFQVMRMPGDRKYWDGEPINPYPLLRMSGARASGG
ncbi:MAG: M23 family metallopeptidase [Gemmatimonadaceae bacterium]